MKFKKLFIAVIIVLCVSNSVFAWGTRTGTRTGDALVYGAGGGILAGAGA